MYSSLPSASPYGPPIPALQQQLDRGGHGVRIRVGIRAQLHRPVRRGLGDAGHVAPFQPWKTAAFSADASWCAASSSAAEVAVVGAAVGVAQLAAGDGEVRAQLDQRQHATAEPGDAAGRLGRDRLRPSQVRRRVLPAVRAREVDQLAGREGRREALAGLVLEGLPAPAR